MQPFVAFTASALNRSVTDPFRLSMSLAPFGTGPNGALSLFHRCRTLSESSKSMSHASEPKLFGEHTRFAEALGGRKALEVVDKAAPLMVQASILVISAEDACRLPPEVFDGVEVGTAFGQPQPLDAEPLGQAQRTLGGVTGVFI